mgnify:CR=1 FL=1
MGRLTLVGKLGRIRILSGDSPPYYVEIPFSNMDLNAPFARSRPIDPIIPNATGFSHAPKDESYDAAFYEPQSLSFSCKVDFTTNSWKLRQALCNPDLQPVWSVGGNTWTSTKGRGSIILADGKYVGTRPFFDTKKVAVKIEALWEDSRAGSAVGMSWDETYIPPQDVSIEESADDVTLSIDGLVYGAIQILGGFTSGTES